MDFHYTVATNKTIDEAIRALEQNLKAHQFGILWQLDLSAKLQEKGIDGFHKPYRILEVCNPFEAAKVLSHNVLVGYFLPCKITVYEGEGKTMIGLPKPSSLLTMLDDQELKEIGLRIEETLIRILDESK
ncbi:MAG: DUF302 domain-containing protein [Clostridia bacterium]